MTIHRSAWQARDRRAESELEVVMGALVWKVLGTGAAIGAGVVARKLVTRGWTAATGKEPPANPEDPQVSWPEAVGWAVASGAFVGVARLLATRKAAAYYTKSAGHPPKRLQQAS
ncbi:MAG TPA: DUF4235 domain-containing protein [Dermatophilaceae bacterium]|jgi:hypothetical protein